MQPNEYNNKNIIPLSHFLQKDKSTYSVSVAAIPDSLL